MANQRIRGAGIEVHGLAELNKSLKDMGDEFKGEMRKTNKVVADFVADGSRSAASGLGSTAAHVAPFIKASAGAVSAAVTLNHPAGAGAEFGGQGRPSTMQFEPHRGSGPDAGYFVYPTIRRDLDEIESKYEEGMDKLLKKVGLL